MFCFFVCLVFVKGCISVKYHCKYHNTSVSAVLYAFSLCNRQRIFNFIHHLQLAAVIYTVSTSPYHKEKETGSILPPIPNSLVLDFLLALGLQSVADTSEGHWVIQIRYQKKQTLAHPQWLSKRWTSAKLHYLLRKWNIFVFSSKNHVFLIYNCIYYTYYIFTR